MERTINRLADRPRPAGNPLARLLRLLVRLDADYRNRRSLQALDQHLLRDIGLTDHATRRWDVPEIMRRK